MSGPTITAWRITAPAYAETAFSGIGSERYGGRWSSPGRRVVYTAASLSLALLEMLVRANDRRRLRAYLCRSATFDASLVEHVELAALPEGWDARPYTRVSQQVGDRWLDAGQALVLAVPSVVVPQEVNYLVNPLHPAMAQVTLGPAMPLPFDERLG